MKSDKKQMNDPTQLTINANGRIMELIQAGMLNTECLITHRTTLDHIMEAYDVFENRRDHVIKVAVRVN